MKLFLLAPLAAVVMLFSSFNTIRPSDMNVSVADGKFFINGMELKKKWKFTTCTDAMGKPDRSTDGYNFTHTYDSLSCVLFEPKNGRKGGGVVTEVQFYFNLPAKPSSNAPKKGLYKGKMVIGTLNITGDLTADQMHSGMNGWSESDSYTEHNFRMAQKGIYIYFLFNDEETKLLKVSIGPDKAKKKK
jgi:hypothetical protein